MFLKPSQRFCVFSVLTHCNIWETLTLVKYFCLACGSVYIGTDLVLWVIFSKRLGRIAMSVLIILVYWWCVCKKKTSYTDQLTALYFLKSSHQKMSVNMSTLFSTGTHGRWKSLLSICKSDTSRICLNVYSIWPNKFCLCKVS